MNIVSLIHRLLNPHCPDCRDKEEYNKICNSCETLKNQLEIVNYEKRQMLDSILNNNKPVISEKPAVNYEELKPMSVPWAVRKQMLEADDRERARLMKQASSNLRVNIRSDIVESDKEIEDLEKQLGITNS